MLVYLKFLFCNFHTKCIHTEYEQYPFVKSLNNIHLQTVNKVALNNGYQFTHSLHSVLKVYVQIIGNKHCTHKGMYNVFVNLLPYWPKTTTHCSKTDSTVFPCG